MPPSRSVTAPDDKGPLIVVITLLCVVAGAYFVGAKILTKYAKYRTLHSHDYCCFVALILNVLCAVTTYMQIECGLGKANAVLTQRQTETLLKNEYVLHIFFVISLALSKLTVLDFLSTLALDPPKARIVRMLEILAVLFGVTSLLVTSLQCTPPDAWRSTDNKCIDKSAFWDFYAAFDSLMSLTIAALPVHLIWRVQIKWQKKFRVIVAFSGNLCAIPPVILRSVFIRSAQSPVNTPWTHTNGILMTQVAVNVSLIASCVAFVRPFLGSVVTGMLSADLRDRPTTDATLTSHRTRLLYVVDLLRPRPLVREVDSERMYLRSTLFSPPERDGAVVHTASANGAPPHIQVFRDDDINIHTPERVHFGSIKKTVEVQVFPN